MAFGFYRSVTVDNTKVHADLTDFPVFVDVTHNDLRTVGNGGNVQNASGYDICFYADSALSTPLSWEMEVYDAATGRVRAYVKIPSLANAVDTVFYMAYGDAGISTFQSTPENAWDSSFKMVHHFRDGSSLSVVDSTSNNNDSSTISGAVASTTLGTSADFDGSNDYVEVTDANSLDMTSDMTLALLIYPDTWTGGERRTLVSKNGNYILWVGNDFGSQQLEGLWFDGTNVRYLNGAVPSTGNPHYVVFKVTSNDASALRVDKSNLDTTPATWFAAGRTLTEHLRYGLHIDGTEPYDGKIGESRLSSSARADGWVDTESDNLISPSTFLTLGSQVVNSSGPVIPVFMSRMRRLAA